VNDAATDAGPGFLAFVAFFALAVVLWFLMRNMNARMRRMSYRQQAAHRRNDEPQATEEDLAEPGAPVDGTDLPDHGGGGSGDGATSAADEPPADEGDARA
jgi:hypothetical protein